MFSRIALTPQIKFWIDLTPQITRVTGSYRFKRKAVGQQINHSLSSSQGAFNYNYAQMQKN